MGTPRRVWHGLLLVVSAAHLLVFLLVTRGHKTPPPAPPILLPPQKIVVTVTAPKQSLLVRARKVADNGEAEWFQTHQWLSTTKLLAVKAEYGSEHISVGVLDIETNRFQPLRKVNNKLPEVSAWSYRSCEVSPDGQWLLEHDGDGTNVMRLDGSDFRHIEDNGRRDRIRWLSDSHHWLNLYGGYNGHFLDYAEPGIYSLRSGQKVQQVPNSESHPLLTAFNEPVHDYDGLLYAAFAIGERLNYAPYSKLIIQRRLLRSVAKQLPPLKIALPSQAVILNVSFSPHCDRVAWLALKPDKAEENPNDVNRGTELSIWVSRLNGEGLHEVGSLEGSFGVCGSQEDQPAQLQWLPDGERLSFVYKNALYTIHAD